MEAPGGASDRDTEETDEMPSKRSTRMGEHPQSKPDPLTAYTAISVCLHASGIVHVYRTRLDATSHRVSTELILNGEEEQHPSRGVLDWAGAGLAEAMLDEHERQLPLW